MGKLTVEESNLSAVAKAIREQADPNGGLLIFPDGFISAVEGIQKGITPTGTKNITTNGSHDVTEFASALVNVPLQHTRISKTTGSSATQNYSIPLSEIGFTPRAYAIIMYNTSDVSSAVSNQPHIVGTANNLGSANPAGCISASNKGAIKLQTVGGSFKGAVNGTNFTFTSTYAYLRGSTRYYFYFWG